MYEIEATVVPGFEMMAKEEIQEKLNCIDVKCSRGHVNFHVTESNILSILELRSVDNLYFIEKLFENLEFTTDKEACLSKITECVPLIDWKLIVDVWSKFFKFNSQIDYAETVRVINEYCPKIKENEKETLESNNANDQASVLLIPKEPNILNTQSEVVTNITVSEKDSGSNTGLDESINNEKPTKNVLLPSFRVTCNRTGSHSFQSPMAACEFGGEINDLLQWNVDLDNYDIEVVLLINNNQVKVGTALTKQSLHRRDLTKFGRTSLRPTIAYGMLRLCRPLPGDIISDPMCGCGSIPLEAAISYPNCFHLAGDMDFISVERTQKNIQNIKETRFSDSLCKLNIDVFNWDSGRLPFKDSCVDVFITDLPFGKRVGSKATNWQLYPYVLSEMARVSRLNSGRACLLTKDRKCIQHVIGKLGHLWKRGPTVVTNIGGLTAAVFLLFRTNTPFDSTLLEL